MKIKNKNTEQNIDQSEVRQFIGRTVTLLEVTQLVDRIKACEFQLDDVGNGTYKIVNGWKFAR
jgi:hypothetical protein